MRRPLLLMFLVCTTGFAVNAQEGARSRPGTAPDPSLAALDWLAGGRWVARIDDPKAPNLMRETFFLWSPNGQALRFWSYVVNRELLRTPYVEGWYVFHPGRKQISFTYVDSAGYYAGDVKAQGDLVDHEFEGISKSGHTRRYRYTFRRLGADEMNVGIFQDSGGTWQPVLELVYRRQPF